MMDENTRERNLLHYIICPYYMPIRTITLLLDLRAARNHNKILQGWRQLCLAAMSKKDIKLKSAPFPPHYCRENKRSFSFFISAFLNPEILIPKDWGTQENSKMKQIFQSLNYESFLLETEQV